MNDSTKSLNDAGESSETPEQKKARKREANRIAVAEWHKRNPDYQKKRKAAIKAGTWPFRNAKSEANTPAPTDAAPCSSEPPGES